VAQAGIEHQPGQGRLPFLGRVGDQARAAMLDAFAERPRARADARHAEDRRLDELDVALGFVEQAVLERRDADLPRGECAQVVVALQERDLEHPVGETPERRRQLERAMDGEPHLRVALHHGQQRGRHDAEVAVVRARAAAVADGDEARVGPDRTPLEFRGEREDALVQGIRHHVRLARNDLAHAARDRGRASDAVLAVAQHLPVLRRRLLRRCHAIGRSARGEQLPAIGVPIEDQVVHVEEAGHAQPPGLGRQQHHVRRGRHAIEDQQAMERQGRAASLGVAPAEHRGLEAQVLEHVDLLVDAIALAGRYRQLGDDEDARAQALARQGRERREPGPVPRGIARRQRGDGVERRAGAPGRSMRDPAPGPPQQLRAAPLVEIAVAGTRRKDAQPHPSVEQHQLQSEAGFEAVDARGLRRGMRLQREDACIALGNLHVLLERFEVPGLEHFLGPLALGRDFRGMAAQPLQLLHQALDPAREHAVERRHARPEAQHAEPQALFEFEGRMALPKQRPEAAQLAADAGAVHQHERPRAELGAPRREVQRGEARRIAGIDMQQVDAAVREGRGRLALAREPRVHRMAGRAARGGLPEGGSRHAALRAEVDDDGGPRVLEQQRDEGRMHAPGARCLGLGRGRGLGCEAAGGGEGGERGHRKALRGRTRSPTILPTGSATDYSRQD